MIWADLLANRCFRFAWTSSKDHGLWLVIWWISIRFVCFCVSRFVACDRPVSGNNRTDCFEDVSWSFLFLSLARIKQSTSYPRQFPLTIAISFAIFEYSIVILSLRAKLGECAITSPHSNDRRNIEKPKIPSKFAKRAVQYNEFGRKYWFPLYLFKWILQIKI